MTIDSEQIIICPAEDIRINTRDPLITLSWSMFQNWLAVDETGDRDIWFNKLRIFFADSNAKLMVDAVRHRPSLVSPGGHNGFPATTSPCVEVRDGG